MSYPNINLGRNIVKSYNVFSGNTLLKTINITGNNVTAIEDYTFSGCTSLTSITSDATKPPTIYENTFYGVDRSIPVNVPCCFMNDYKTKWNSAAFTNYQSIEDICDSSSCGDAIKDIAVQKIQIYPNPAKDEIFIKSDSPIKKVEIYSLTSALLLSDNDFNGKITVSTLLKGIYLVKVYTDKCLTISKIVKE